MEKRRQKYHEKTHPEKPNRKDRRRKEIRIVSLG